MKDETHPQWKGDKLQNYTSIHSYLRKFKKGICEFCFRNGKTQNALKKGKRHERKLENYLELCPKCHIAYDKTEQKILQWKENLKKSPSHMNKITDIKCALCNKLFKPRRKTTRFCSNSCASKLKPKRTNKRDKLTGRYLAINKK